MTLLVLGLAVFLGAHFVSRLGGTRAALVARLGEGGYKGLYSLVSTLGLALAIYGYAHAPYVAVWEPPAGLRHLPILLMWPAFVLLVAAYLPGHIRAKAKYPMLAAVKLWATAHLLANGDLASMVLFGSFLAWGVLARVLLKRTGPDPSVPRAASWRSDVAAAAIGTAVYGLFGAYLHPILIGVPAFPH